ncbi:MAG: alpha/beta hydrolase [Gammaproteobacteria bacterium]
MNDQHVNTTAEVRVTKVKVPSGGLNLVCDLYEPVGTPPAAGYPGLVIGHGFSFIKEGLVNQGHFFARQGYVTLAIDYRTFGESEGEPRGQLFPLNEVEDYRNSISWLENRDNVDAARIGIWGTSFGGAVVIYTAAMDTRVKAVVSQVPVVNGRAWLRSLRSPDQWEELLDAIVEDRRRRFRGEPSRRIKVTGMARHGDEAVMPADKEINEFLDNARSALKTWCDTLTLESAEKVIEFDPSSVIHLISPRPLRIVTAAGYDIIHPLDQINDAYRKANEPKDLVLLPFRQLDMYTQPKQDVGLQHALDWFDRWL